MVWRRGDGGRGFISALDVESVNQTSVVVMVGVID